MSPPLEGIINLGIFQVFLKYGKNTVIYETKKCLVSNRSYLIQVALKFNVQNVDGI